ncbi:MAG TPA: ATP-binding protein [Malonomonas sp.]
MGLRDSIHASTSGFRGRLLTIVTFGIIGLALTASITTAWVTSNRAAEQMVAQGLQITDTLAAQSVLGLIYASQENAEKPLATVMSFPDVIQAGIFHSDYSPLAKKGGGRMVLPVDNDLGMNGARLTEQNADAWHFIAPVLTGDQATNEEDSQFQLVNPRIEQLGYVYVVMGKATLRELQVSIFLNNIFIALSFAAILAFLVNIGINRLLQPLFKLIRVMEQSEKEGTRVYAELKGPKEITLLASVFNRMMNNLNERDKRLREHGEMLESEVAIRTHELLEARDAALTASRHKSEVLANISHELRTPLQAIIGYSDVVREDLELEGMDNHAEELTLVIRNAERLMTLINNILDMAKIESGKMDLKLQAVDINALLKEAGATIFPILRQNNNQLSIEALQEQTEVQLDKEKLLQIVLNLLSNAGKFTRQGSIRVTPHLSERLLTIKVSDTGIGLTAEQQKLIFEEFRQIDGSTTRSFEGTGLGLAITKRFCELMGGTIEVESEPGKGSTFSIIIPLPLVTASHHQTETLVNGWSIEEADTSH